MFDTFISYRRQGGSDYAPRVYDYLEERGYRPFYDHIGMENGRFDEQIRRNLINAINFVLILSKGALDRAGNEGDWVAKEISLAIKFNLNIAVLKEEGFAYPSTLLNELVSLAYYQNYEFTRDELGKVLKAIETKLLRRENQFTLDDPLEDEPIRIGGEYISLCQDNDHGKLVVRKTPAQIRLVGSHIHGTTTFGSRKKWKLQGKVYKGKRISGIYYAKSLLDDGFGTFFLEAKSPSILEGYWCVYDSENHEVFCGKYLFKKLYKRYLIREVREEDFIGIVRIGDAQLGGRYVTPSFLWEAMAPSSPYRCIGAAGKKTWKVIGFLIYETINCQTLEDITKGKPIEEFSYSDKIGYIKTSAVDSHYEGYGIGNALTEKAVESLRKAGSKVFVSTAWKQAGVINLHGILSRNKFRKRLEIPDYWYEDSIKEGFECPQCGNPCHCACVIYIRY